MSHPRLTRAVLILAAALSGSGCAALHKTDPPILAGSAAPVSKEPLSYGLLYDLPPPDTRSYSGEKKRRDRLAAMLSQCVAEAGFSRAQELSVVGESVQAVAETLASTGSQRHFIVRVVHHPWPPGSNGAAAFSGLFLGLIPAWESMTAYEVESARYEVGREPSVKTHTIRITQMYGIIFLPICWMTLTSTAERELEKTMRAGLTE